MGKRCWSRAGAASSQGLQPTRARIPKNIELHMPEQSRLTNKEQAHRCPVPHHPASPNASHNLQARTAHRPLCRMHKRCKWHMIRYQPKRPEGCEQPRRRSGTLRWFWNFRRRSDGFGGPGKGVVRGLFTSRRSSWLLFRSDGFCCEVGHVELGGSELARRKIWRKARRSRLSPLKL